MPERLLTAVSTTDSNPLLFREYKVPDDFDPGDRFEQVSPFEQTEILAAPQVLGTIEFHENEEPFSPQQENSFDTQQYLAEVNKVQIIFDRAFGKSIKILNYNPVLEIAKYRSLKATEQKDLFPDYEKVQIETALKERFSAATSTIFYEVDQDNKLRSQQLKNQPFEDILQTGIEYYKTLNSPDIHRMEKEREGFLKIQQVLTNPDTPENTKITVISGPGQVLGTIFKDNFVDIYEVSEDPITKKRIIKMTRFSSSKTYAQYKEAVSLKNADYFNGQEGPIDEWFLSNPILGEILTENRKALSEEKMQIILQQTAPHINSLIERVCETIINPENVAIALNAVLNKADIIWQNLQTVTQKVTSFVSKVREKVMPVFKTLAEEIYWLGHQVVRAVGAGCGLSGGFSIGRKGIRSGGSSAGGGSASGREGLLGTCGVCGSSTADDHYHCEECPRKYDSERNTPPENRTKKCPCGFKFDC